MTRATSSCIAASFDDGAGMMRRGSEDRRSALTRILVRTEGMLRREGAEQSVPVVIFWLRAIPEAQ